MKQTKARPHTSAHKLETNEHDIENIKSNSDAKKDQFKAKINGTPNSSVVRKNEKEPADTRERMANLPFGARIDELEKMRKRRKI